MKFKFSIALSMVFVLFVLASFDHPLKLTTSLIEYNAEKGNLSLECRVFIDDFQLAVNRRDLDAANLTPEDIDKIEYYFDRFYPMVLNDRKLSLDYKNSVVFGANNVLSLRFEIDNLKIKKGDEVWIENKLLFEDFGFLQSNKMTIRIPPFVKEDYYEADHKKYTVHYQF